jgi:hypothetical protein
VKEWIHLRIPCQVIGAEANGIRALACFYLNDLGAHVRQKAGGPGGSRGPAKVYYSVSFKWQVSHYFNVSEIPSVDPYPDKPGLIIEY